MELTSDLVEVPNLDGKVPCRLTSDLVPNLDGELKENELKIHSIKNQNIFAKIKKR